jgi:preprotein translocase subunit SecB
MTRINYEMVRLRLQKSVFLLNPNYQQPPQGEVIALGLNLRNGGEFFQNDSMANFVQCFQTRGGGSEVPFSLEVEMAALFSLSAPVPANEHQAFIHQIFPQMVFPHTREYIAEITRRGGFPPLLLNLGLFQDQQKTDSASTLELLSGSKWIH